MEILEYREKWFKDDNPHFRNVQHVALDPDGNWAAFGSKAGLLFATADDGELKVVVRNRGCTITSLLWQVSRGVICGYNDGTIANIFIRKDALITGVLGTGQAIEIMTLDEQGLNLAGGKADDIRIWKRDQNGFWIRRSNLGSPRRKQDNENLDVVLTGLHWKNSTANQLIASYKYHGVQIWNVQTGEVESIIIQQTIPIGPTALSPDYQYLAVMARGGIDVYQASTGRQLAVLTIEAGQDRPVIFVHNGNTVFAAGAKGEARLWAVPRGRRMQSMRHPDKEPITALSEYVNPYADVFRLATVSESHVCIWEAIRSDTVEAGGIAVQPRSSVATQLFYLCLWTMVIILSPMLWRRFGLIPNWL